MDYRKVIMLNQIESIFPVWTGQCRSLALAERAEDDD